MIPIRTGIRGSRPAALLSEGYGYIVNKIARFYHKKRARHIGLAHHPKSGYGLIDAVFADRIEDVGLFEVEGDFHLVTDADLVG